MNDDDDMGQMLDDPSSQRPSITMSVDDLDFGDDGVFDEWLVGNNHYDGMYHFPPPLLLPLQPSATPHPHPHLPSLHSPLIPSPYDLSLPTPSTTPPLLSSPM